LAKHRFTSRTEARLVIFRYIEGWYNPHRRHSALGQRSPLAFEQAHAITSEAAQVPNPTGSTKPGQVQTARWRTVRRRSPWRNAHVQQCRSMGREAAINRDNRRRLPEVPSVHAGCTRYRTVAHQDFRARPKTVRGE
jgi:hypothetical protein